MIETVAMSVNEFERNVVSVGAMTEEMDDVSYWCSRTMEERLAGLEFLRQQFYSYAGAEQELRRWYKIGSLRDEVTR